MILVRCRKVVLVSAIARFFTLVAFGNVTNHQSNWQFVQHVLSMDPTFPKFEFALARCHKRAV